MGCGYGFPQPKVPLKALFPFRFGWLWAVIFVLFCSLSFPSLHLTFLPDGFRVAADVCFFFKGFIKVTFFKWLIYKPVIKLNFTGFQIRWARVCLTGFTVAMALDNRTQMHPSVSIPLSHVGSSGGWHITVPFHNAGVVSRLEPMSQ